MKKDIDEILKEKCKKINVDYDFKVTNDVKKNSVMYKLVASFAALFLIVFSLHYIKDSKITHFEGEKDFTNLDIAEYVISPELTQEVRGDDSTKYFSSDSYETSIVIAETCEILGYKNYIEKLDMYSYPITCIRAKVINSLKGNLNGTFDFYKQGGIISVEDYEKISSDYETQKLKEYLNGEEGKSHTHINLTFAKNYNEPKIEIGRTYMLILRYDSELFDMYTISGTMQRVFEYDSKTCKIKNESTNEWIYVDEFLESNKDII